MSVPVGGRIPVKLHRRVCLVQTEDAVLAEELLARKKLAQDIVGRLTDRVLLVRAGRVDAVVSTNDGPAHILHNETPTQNHWLKLKLVGHKSNRDAIGAEVKLVTAKGQQCATVSTAGSYLSASDKRVHFGLGSESSASSVEIRWPSGITQTLRNIRADQILTVDEPSPAAAQK